MHWAHEQIWPVVLEGEAAGLEQVGLLDFYVGDYVGAAVAVLASGLPRVFRTPELVLFYAANCRFRYSVRTSCGVRYPSAE